MKEDTHTTHAENRKRSQQEEHDQPREYPTNSGAGTNKGAGGIVTKPARAEMISLKGRRRVKSKRKLAPIVGNTDIRSYLLKGRVVGGGQQAHTESTDQGVGDLE